ncbi:hypothetical protein F2Q70_00026063 [Brassica cretica]|uniref:Uncharacterized protein n=1 Tax=Brassica cretica TaxID=69181 RepID=A0A8S9L3L7_BRACR|nr:hypothetical protein F2Q68_00025184 [Brassica cretica]KAF2602650.1 hypothetical protein F2Q70_00026063 [Brassica cretica]
MNLQASATSRDAEDLLFFRMPHFVLEMFAGLKMFRDVARIAKDVVGQGLDHGTLTFTAIRSPRGLLHNQCGLSGGMTAFLDVTGGKEKQKPASRMVLHKACYVNFRKFLRKTWSDITKDFLRESCLELLMECYRSLFQYDLVA